MFYEFFKPFYILRLERGEEAISTIKKFVEKEKIKAGLIFGIGAMENVEIGYYDYEKKDYIKKSFEKPVEVLSLNGSISNIDEKPYLHIHSVISDENLNSHGGHFFKGFVSATLEVYIFPLKGKLKRYKDEKENFYFLKLKEKI